MANLLIPERRRRVRIVTLKNFGIFVLASLALLAAAELVVRTRRPETDGYGRIVQRQLPQPAVATRAPEVVTEGEIADQNGADPWLVEPAARSQYLGNPQLPAPGQAQAAPATEVAPRPSNGPVAIVGNGGEIHIVRSDGAPKPQLSGGIFKSDTTRQ